MPTLLSNNPNLRRLHPINREVLREKLRLLEAHPDRYDPVSILTYAGIPGRKYLVVVDGTHRVQAAIQANRVIRYREADEGLVRREAERRGFSLDELIQRSQRFERLSL